MAAALKLGGFSSCCVFHRQLGSDDEAAGLQERAERLLYFFPRDLPLTAQLKHVGFCEGLIDFATTFNGPFVTLTLALHKRKYVLLQPEPDLWLVLVLVNHQMPPVGPKEYPRTTDAKAAVGTATAVHAATSRRATLASAGAAIAHETYDNGSHVDGVVAAMARRLYDWHTLFYGSCSRVLAHPDAAAMISRLASLRVRLRKLVDQREALVSNYEVVLARAAEEAAAAQDGATTTAAARQLESLSAQVSAAVAAADAVAAELAVMQSLSPVTALRATLRNVLDFCLHYTDWSDITAFDAIDGVRCHQPTPRVWSAVQHFVTDLELRNPLVQHVALLYDGYVIMGRGLPALDLIYSYLRLHAFHALRGNYVPDTRPLDFTSIAPVPVHPIRSKHGMSGAAHHHHHTSRATAPPLTPVRAPPPPAPILAAATSQGHASASVGRGGGGTTDPSHHGASSMSSGGSGGDPILGTLAAKLHHTAMGTAGTTSNASSSTTDPSKPTPMAAGSSGGTVGDTPSPRRPPMAWSGAAAAAQTQALITTVPWSTTVDATVLRAIVDDACRRAAGVVKGAAAGVAAGASAPTTDATLQRWGGVISAAMAGLDRSLSASGVASLSSSPRGGSGVLASTPPPSHTAAAAAASISNFYRGPKPAILAVPALPAAAATQACLKSVVTVDSRWPVLTLPYISNDYLRSLSAVVSTAAAAGGGDTAGGAALGEDGTVGAKAMLTTSPAPAAGAQGSGVPAAASTPSTLVPAGARRPSVIISTSAQGPPPAKRISSGASSGDAAYAGKSGSSRPRSGSDSVSMSVVMDGTTIFTPSLWCYNTNAKLPSHRLVWYQHGLVTLLCYLDANALRASERPRVLPASPAGSLGSSTGGGGSPLAAIPTSLAAGAVQYALDVPHQPLQELTLRIRERSNRYMADIERALSDSVDHFSSAFVSAGVELYKHVHAEVNEGIFAVHGFASVLRRPGKGRDASGAPVSQAVPLMSTQFAEETPRHLRGILMDLQSGMVSGSPPGRSCLPFGFLETASVGAGMGTPPALRWKSLFEPSVSPLVSHVLMAANKGAAAAWLLWKQRRAAAAGGKTPDGTHGPPLDGAEAELESPFLYWPPAYRCVGLPALPDMPAPYAERHVAATRYEGAVAVRRSHAHRTWYVFNDPLPTIADTYKCMHDLATKYAIE